MSSLTNLLGKCREMAALIAPETQGAITFAVSDDSLPGQCLGTADTVANAIVMHGRQIADYAADSSASLEQITLAVAIHEVAHLLPIRPALVDVSIPEDRQLHERLIAKSVLADQPPPLADYSHDDRFLRRVCHLAIRAAGAGFNFDPGSLWLFDHAGLPHYWLVDLLGEAQQLRAATFEEIENTLPPPAFTTAWANVLHSLNKA